jgi:hypothetical protein
MIKPKANTQTVRGGDAVLTAHIDRELLESLEELLDVSDFATDSCTAEIHLRATTAIRRKKETDAG